MFSLYKAWWALELTGLKLSSCLCEAIREAKPERKRAGMHSSASDSCMANQHMAGWGLQHSLVRTKWNIKFHPENLHSVIQCIDPGKFIDSLIVPLV